MKLYLYAVAKRSAGTYRAGRKRYRRREWPDIRGGENISADYLAKSVDGCLCWSWTTAHTLASLSLLPVTWTPWAKVLALRRYPLRQAQEKCGTDALN